MTEDGEVPGENRRVSADADTDGTVDDPTDLTFVGPATAEVLAAAAFDATDIPAKRVSYRMLVETGVNPGVAAKLRRCHSLSWSFASGSGLARRSEQVRGLQADERAWVAASSGDWAESAVARRTTTDADREGDDDWTPGSGPAARLSADPSDDWTPGDWGDAAASTETAASDATVDDGGDTPDREPAWRAPGVPTPTTAVEGLDAADAALLAEAGVTSVRTLATCRPAQVADALGVEQSRLETWQERATRRVD